MREYTARRTPGSLGKRVLDTRTMVSQLRRRVPSPRYRPERDARSEASKALVARLRHDGIARVDDVVGGEQLARLQAAFERAMADPGAQAEDDASVVHQDFFELDPVFLEVACRPDLVAVVGAYYRRPFALGRAELTRLEPADAGRYGSYQWHHDTRGRQLKAMVLVHDVATDEQGMRFLRGSHRRVYPYDRMYGIGSRFEDDFAQGEPGDVVQCTGPAGTVWLFDTNGLHSGRRAPIGRRDTMIVYYAMGSNLRPLRMKAQDVDALPPAARRVVAANRQIVRV